MNRYLTACGGDGALGVDRDQASLRAGPRRKTAERILVDRLWPRGLRKDAASLDLWSKEVAPTSSLRIWFDHRADRFAEFKQRYRDELKSRSGGDGDSATKSDAGKATLVYAARDLP